MHGMGNRNAEHLVVLIADHFAESPIGNQLDGVNTESCSENSIQRGRRAASLQVTQHAAASLLVCPIGDFRCHLFTDAAELVFTRAGLAVNLSAISGMG